MESIQKQDMDRHQVTFGEIDQKDVQKVCIHTPFDMTEYLGMVETNNGIEKHFRCRCGKEVIEVFNFGQIREI